MILINVFPAFGLKIQINTRSLVASLSLSLHFLHRIHLRDCGAIITSTDVFMIQPNVLDVTIWIGVTERIPFDLLGAKNDVLLIKKLFAYLLLYSRRGNG